MCSMNSNLFLLCALQNLHNYNILSHSDYFPVFQIPIIMLVYLISTGIYIEIDVHKSLKMQHYYIKCTFYHGNKSVMETLIENGRIAKITIDIYIIIVFVCNMYIDF